jgi:hypothetical protein
MNSTAASAQVQGPFAQPDAPQVKLTNGVLHLTVYTPDAAKGFYRGTRFDWAGVIGHLDYAGHSYYGPWFTKTAPGVDDFSIQDSGVVAGPSSAIVGPVEEFFTREKALGFDEAAPGGTFIKIGVGVLRRPDNKDYTSYIQYPIVDGGKRSVQVHSSSITFTQDVMDPASGYGYHYVKTVRLVQGKPQMVIEHTLTSTGKHEIESDVFDHNFLSLDELPIGPAYSITLPFNIQLKHVYGLGLASIDGHRILYKKVLEGQDCFATVMRGFGTTASDYDVKIENTQAHAGLRINGDKPLQSIEIWSIRSVLAVEPYVHIDIKPGESFTWHYTYTYFTMQ